MGKGWDKFGDRRQPGDPTFHKSGAGPFDRATVRHGSYGKGAIAGLHAFQAWCEAWGTEALRVTKPGGYLLAFGGTRTHHRLVCGLEDAGWIIRDELTWVYASGFPKGKANLKPAHEPIVLARKPGPLRPLGIEAGRIGTNGGGTDCSFYPGICLGHPGHGKYSRTIHKPARTDNADAGRWPSNLLLSDPALFDEPNPYVVGSGATSESASGVQQYRRPGTSGWRESKGMFTEGREWEAEGYGDTGGYSRFFIVPKSSRADREPVVRGQVEEQDVQTHGAREQGPLPQQTPQGPIRRENTHPTCKPVDLMRHLIRLVTPSGGTVLDPFLGSGSTAIAAELEGFPWIAIEKEPEYVAIAEARLNGTQRGLGLDVGAPTRKQVGKWDDNATANRHKSGFKPKTGWFGLDGGDSSGEPAA